MHKKNRTKNTDDVLKILCDSIQETLRTATQTDITYSSTFIKTSKTCLRPDIGCFVLFGGGVTGLVAMNFSGQAALEIYRKYHQLMGMPDDELAKDHSAPEVADSMGELMNQSVGRFQTVLRQQVGVGVSQNQPKMIALNQPMRISLEAEVDKPQFRRVEFRTRDNQLFYVEITMEKVEFVLQQSMESESGQETAVGQDGKQEAESVSEAGQGGKSPEDLMRELGL